MAGTDVGAGVCWGAGRPAPSRETLTFLRGASGTSIAGLGIFPEQVMANLSGASMRGGWMLPP